MTTNETTINVDPPIATIGQSIQMEPVTLINQRASESHEFLFTADCHIKRRTWTNSTLLQGDAEAALSKLIYMTRELCNGPMPTTAVIGGDLFDNNRPTSNDLLLVHRYFGEVFRNVYYIRGNHDNVNPSYLESMRPTVMGWIDDNLCDFYELPSHYNGHDDISYSKRPLSRNAWLVGISWDPSDSKFMEMLTYIINYCKTTLLTDSDKILFVVLHCSFKHLLGFDGAYTLDIDQIKNLCGNSNINFLVGHIHTRDTTVYNDRGNYIHSPGSLYPMSIEKMGERHYGSLINMDTGAIRDVPTDVRKYVTVNIKDAKPDLLRWLENHKYKPNGVVYLPTFVRLVVPADYEETLQLPETAEYVFKVDKQFAAALKTAKDANTVYTIHDAVRQELQNEANREMVLEMAEELLSADDPVGTLDEWLKFWGVRRASC
jgi:DNA repair exonuclease SbcCD nuclease subunit